MSQQRNKFLNIGAEAILIVVVAPFLIWLTTSVFSLQAKTEVGESKLGAIKEIVEKQDLKIDHIIDLLIEKKGN